MPDRVYPLRLNTSVLANGEATGATDTLGTLAFAPEFLRCLEAALRAEMWEERLSYNDWDRSPYVVARLVHALSAPLIAAVLAYRQAVRDLDDDETYQQMDDWRDERPYRDARLAAAITPYGMTRRQVDRTERAIGRLVRGRLMDHRPATDTSQSQSA